MFIQIVLLSLLGLLPMVNPPTTATLLLGLSKGMSREHVRRQVNLAALYLFCTLCISFFIGSSILDLFGISIPGLRLAGGLIIGFIGFRMLFPAPSQAAGVDINQSIAFVLISLLSWAVLKLADPVCKLLGASGIDAMTRIMGFLLICMGVQFCINGIKEVAQDPVFHGAPAATRADQWRELPQLEALESELAPKAP